MRRIYYFLILGVLFITPLASNSASVSLYLTNNSFKVGDQFTTSLKIDSESVNINAGQATITYPTDILEAISVDKTNSIFAFWLEEPIIDNAIGKISFIGGATGGYSGGSLQVLNITFKARKSGRAVLNLIDSAVTTSDGSGTNVLTTLYGAEVLVKGTETTETPPTSIITPAPTSPEIIEPPISLPPQVAPPAPVLIDRTPTKAKETPVLPNVIIPFYPDQDAWYNTIANFLVRWDLPEDITGVATAINSDPLFEPEKSEGLFSSKFFPSLKDGLNYLHIRFKNNIGWGEALHYRLGIDTVPPEPFNILVNGALNNTFTVDDPTPQLLFASKDALSGLSDYTIQIDTEMPTSTVESKFTPSPLLPTTHTIKISARDNAGNVTENSVDIKVLPIESPIIDSINRDIYTDEGGLNIGGSSLPSIDVLLSLKNKSGVELASKEVSSDRRGVWNARFDESLKKGLYYIEATARDLRGAQSLLVKSEDVKVTTRPILVIFGIAITETWFFIGIILLLLIGFATAYLSYYFWRLQLGRKIIIAQRDVENVLNLINKDTEKILKNLSTKKVSTQKLSEVKQLSEHVNEHISKMKKYLTELIEEID